MGGQNQPIAMGLNKITGLLDGTANDDAATVGQVATAIAAVPATGSVTNAKLANMAASTIKANITGSAAAPVDSTLTQVLDALSGNAQGSIAYRGASAWTVLAPGTSGQFLKTLGAAANPTWGTITVPTPDWTLVKKTADQTVSATTAYADDSELKFTAAANTTYAFRGLYSVSTVSTGGFKFAMNGPATPSKFLVQSILQGGTAAVTAYDTLIAGTGGAFFMLIAFQGVITTGASGGVLTMRLSQNSAAGTATFQKGSYLEYAITA